MFLPYVRKKHTAKVQTHGEQPFPVVVLAPDVRRRAALARGAVAAEDTDGEPTTKTAQHVARQLRPAGGGALAASGHDDDVTDRSTHDSTTPAALFWIFGSESPTHARAFCGLHLHVGKDSG